MPRRWKLAGKSWRASWEGWVLVGIADHSAIPDIHGNRLEIRDVAPARRKVARARPIANRPQAASLPHNCKKDQFGLSPSTLSGYTVVQRGDMKKYGKFAVLIAVVVGTLAWLATTGMNETKTYYKTITELGQMGNGAYGKRLRVGGDVESGSI